LDNQGLIPGRRRNFFSSPPHPDQLWRPPASYSLKALSLVVKQSGHETDHSPPSRAEDKNAQGYTSTFPRLQGMVISLAQDTYSWCST